jgi:hypothetical protein
MVIPYEHFRQLILDCQEEDAAAFLKQHPELAQDLEADQLGFLLLAMQQRMPFTAGLIIRFRNQFTIYEMTACGFDDLLIDTLKQGFIDKSEGPYGYSLMATAVHFGQDHLFAIVLPYSADRLAWKDAEGRSLLHIAVERKHASSIQWLIQAGANVFARNAKEQTPVELALSLGRHSLAALFESTNH